MKFFNLEEGQSARITFFEPPLYIHLIPKGDYPKFICQGKDYEMPPKSCPICAAFYKDVEHIFLGMGI